MEQSHKRAVEHICGISSKKRGRSPTLPRTMETRATKKARVDSVTPAITPEMPNIIISAGTPFLSPMSHPNKDLSATASSPVKSGLPYQQSYQATISKNNVSFTFTSPLTMSSFGGLSIQQGLHGLSETSVVSTTHVGQNNNSTWFINSSPTVFTQNSNIRAAFQENHLFNSLKPMPHTTYHDALRNDDGLDLQAHPKRRSRKKPEEDDSSFEENSSRPQPIEEAEVISLKKLSTRRKSTTAGRTGFKNRKSSSYHENVQEGKPEPVGNPEVWAFKRQQLCETLPYYNAYQSGAYMQDGVARSMLIDKEVGIRDKFDSQVVITSV